MACLRLFFSRTSRCTGGLTYISKLAPIKNKPQKILLIWHTNINTDLTLTAPNLMRRRLKRRKCCSEKGQSSALQLLLVTFAREIPLKKKNCQFRVGSTSSGFYKKLGILTLVCRWECISSDSSNLLLSLIRPRLVLSGWNHPKTQNFLFWLWLSSNIPGHTHHGCNTTHGQGILYFFMGKVFSIFIVKVFSIFTD